MNSSVNYIDLKYLVNFIKKHIWVLILSIIIPCCAIAIVDFCFTTPLYTASAKVMVSNSQIAQVNVELLNDDQYLEELDQELKLDIDASTLKNRISTDIDPDTDEIIISVNYESSKTALKILKKILETYPENLENVFGDLNFVIVEEASTTDDITYPNYFNNFLSAIIFGIIAGIIILLVFCRLNDKVDKLDKIQRNGDIPYLLWLPNENSRSKKKHKVGNNTESRTSKPFNTAHKYSDSINQKMVRLYSRIENLPVFADRGKVILFMTTDKQNFNITPPLLAKITCQKNKTLLIDGNLLNGMLGKALDISGLHPGLNEVLKGETTYSDTIVHINKNLDFIPAGYSNEECNELFNSKAFKELLDNVSKNYEYILIQGTTVDEYAKSETVFRIIDYIFVVSIFMKTKESDFIFSLDEIKNYNGNLVGVVVEDEINKMRDLCKEEKY